MLDRVTLERMAATARESPILIALSGGGDSVALLHLLVEALGSGRLRAAVVDHALRPGSDEDARRAKALADALDVAAEVLPLTWPDGPQRSQARAREARYAALCEAARRFGACLIATGHTYDDQAETVLLRASRGSGWRGLAGMRAIAPAPLWPEGRGLRIARPLLATSRARLRDELRARGAHWIEDPANANEDFARVRARRVLSALAQAGLDTNRLTALADRLAAHAAELDQAALALVGGAVAFEADSVVISTARWRGPDAVRQRALSALLTAAGAGASEPPLEQVAALEERLTQAGFPGATLAGARLKRTARGVCVERDAGALSGRADGATPMPPFALEANCACVWDRRLALTAPEAGWSVVVEDGAPLLARCDKRAPLSAVPGVWLLRARVEHLLKV